MVTSTAVYSMLFRGSLSRLFTFSNTIHSNSPRNNEVFGALAFKVFMNNTVMTSNLIYGKGWDPVGMNLEICGFVRCESEQTCNTAQMSSSTVFTHFVVNGISIHL
jgi:hypothetical protein